MLDGIRADLDSPDHEDHPFVRLDSIELSKHTGVMKLSVLGPDGQEVWKRWVLRAGGMLDYEIREPHGDLSVHDGDHVLARQHSDSHRGLMFRGAPRSAFEVTGALLAAHEDTVGDWIPFRRYLNTCRGLEDLLVGGFGKLAGGPSFLMHAYGAVLERSGMVPNLLPPVPPRLPSGSQRTSAQGELAVLTVGNSYVVAETFDEISGPT